MMDVHVPLAVTKGLRLRGIDVLTAIYASRTGVTIGQMVTDLSLIAAAMTQDEWLGKIERLPL